MLLRRRKRLGPHIARHPQKEHWHIRILVAKPVRKVVSQPVGVVLREQRQRPRGRVPTFSLWISISSDTSKKKHNRSTPWSASKASSQKKSKAKRPCRSICALVVNQGSYSRLRYIIVFSLVNICDCLHRHRPSVPRYLSIKPWIWGFQIDVAVVFFCYLAQSSWDDCTMSVWLL